MKSAPTVPPSGWTRGHFWSFVGGVFVLQAGLILLFGEHNHTRPAMNSGPVYFHLLGTPLNSEEMAKTFFAIDPIVFPLPGTHGFSEHAWLTLSPPSSEAPSPTEAPAWLSLNTKRLGTNFSQLHEARAGFPFDLTVPESAELEPWPASLAPEEFRTQSPFEIQGALETRQLNAPPALPARTNILLLSNSVVQIGVDSAGQVIATRLLRRSGSADADNYALNQARNLRFRPAPLSGPVWGRVVIEWQTIAPTNAGSPATP